MPRTYAVKRLLTKSPGDTDDLGLCGVVYEVVPVLMEKQVRLIEMVGKA